MRRKFRIAATVFFIVLIAGGTIAANVFFPTKEFSLPRVDVDATLAPDGSMNVVEHITYDFSGQFHYGTRPIPVGAYTISDMRVTEHGQQLLTSGAPYNLQWFFTAEDEQRTFDISYTVTGAVLTAPDVAELYWKWVGEDHPTIGLVTATLHVPPGVDRLRAWGHGPLNGTVRVDDELVRWHARDVPQGTFVEGRVAIPPSRLPGLAPTQPPRLAQILAEEASFIAATKDARAREADIAQRDRRLRDALEVGSPVAVAVGVLVFLLLWRRYGREPRIDTQVGEYERELPDDPPAVVASLMHWGADRPEGLSSTVLDLAQRGYLGIRETREDRALLPDRVDYELTRRGAPTDDLHPWELTALELVFAGSSVVRHSEIAKWARAHRSEAQETWTSFKNEVQSSLRGRRYLNGGRSLPFFLNVVCGALVGLVGFGAIAHDRWPLGVVAVLWAAVQIALTPLLRQRTPAGHERYLRWRGVRNYLRDFSQLADAPAGHLVLWERYLVYAAALGVSEQLAEGLAVHLPTEDTPGFAPWYVGHSAGNGTTASFASIGSFASGLGASTASFSPPSSSGGGGGFSGGGGGGGGGGGIGAG